MRVIYLSAGGVILSGEILMTENGLFQIILYFITLMLLAKPLGVYMAMVYENRPVVINRLLAPLEAGFYHLSGVSPEQDMRWKEYAAALLWFNLFGGLAVFALQMLQAHLPLNPEQLGNVTVDSAFNTAVSFITNTNWQGYSGETTMSYFTQMLGLNVQNFVSAATGMAVLVAMIRGFQRTHADGIGNFWADLTRGILYILLPLSFLIAVALVGQGVVQTIKPYQTVPLVEQVSSATEETTQTLALGPAASQIAIKQLGTNGGGFFNANSAHPYENPTPLSNFLEMLLLVLIPAALCHTFGTMVGDTRQGWAILSAMTLVLISLVFVTVAAEQVGNPALIASVKARIKALRDVDPSQLEAVPVDLVTASASGLDPHISPAAAKYQISRVAIARHLSPNSVSGLVDRYTEGRQWRILGEPRVNVLELNLALDQHLK
jgi:K+-transporting ATPase ATPase A chain